MCGRFTLKTPAAQWLPMFVADMPSAEPDVPLRYNVAPTQRVSAVRNEDGSRSLIQLRWGLIPFWAKDKSIGSRMINARSETAATKPSFRSAFKSRRCLIVADGFYEWLKTDDGKQPVHICREDRQPFAMAGLWESWKQKCDESKKSESKNNADEAIESCTILTTTSNELLSSVHDRMPVILNDDDFDRWLDCEFQDRDQLQQLMLPFSSDEMMYYPVSKEVNSARNDTPACVDPIDDPKSETA